MPISHRLRDRLVDHYALHGPIDRNNPLPLPAGAEQARALVTLGGFKTDASLMAALPALGLIGPAMAPASRVWTARKRSGAASS